MSNIIDSLTAMSAHAWLKVAGETIAAVVVITYADYCAAAIFPDWRRGGVPSAATGSPHDGLTPEAK